MKVVMLNLAAGALSGGYCKYINKLVPLLLSNPKIERLQVYIPENSSKCIKNVNKNVINLIPHYVIFSGFKSLKRMILKNKPDVIFIPTAQWLNIREIPVVNMVRNMEPLLMPFCNNNILESIKNILRYVIAKRAVEKSVRVIAVSKFVKEYLIKKFRIKDEKISIVYHGVDLSDFTKAEKLQPPYMLNGVNGKFNRFIFTAGSIRPARGLEDIIEAFALIYKEAKDVALVISGEASWLMDSYKDAIKKQVSDLGISPRVVWTGQLNEYQMQWCYLNCELFVMTSRAEACPNTALEAMANGCNIISTESPPMPEFFDDAALYYKAGQPESLAEKIKEVLGWNNDKRREMSRQSLKVASRYSWETCAQNTILELQKAIETKK